jgi:hypothetical protein
MEIRITPTSDLCDTSMSSCQAARQRARNRCSDDDGGGDGDDRKKLNLLHFHSYQTL